MDSNRGRAMFCFDIRKHTLDFFDKHFEEIGPLIAEKIAEHSETTIERVGSLITMKHVMCGVVMYEASIDLGESE